MGFEAFDFFFPFSFFFFLFFFPYHHPPHHRFSSSTTFPGHTSRMVFNVIELSTIRAGLSGTLYRSTEYLPPLIYHASLSLFLTSMGAQYILISILQ